MEVYVIGPIFPFRGGIAHSNRMLCENLAKTNDLTVISFSRMYPEALYPGRGQMEAGPDPSFTLPAEYILDSMNPFSWLRVARRIRKEKPDRVIFQWWHTFFTPMFWTIRRLSRNGRTRFGVICQNVLPHEEGWIHEKLTHIFFKGIDYFIALCRSDLGILGKLMPRKHARWITETTYESQFGRKPGREGARKRLGLVSDVLLFFGFVRPYKGLAYLLKALPAIIESRPRLILMIVGEFWKDRKLYEGLIDDLGLRPNVMIVDRYVSNEEVPVYFAAADAVVLPYVASAESGIIQLAYGLNTPIIATAVGGHVDLINHGRTGMLCKPEDPNDLARVILEYYEKGLEATVRAGMDANADLFRWTAPKERAVLDT
jgi:glycosyltransferase involved in cell wall biosynthesis